MPAPPDFRELAAELGFENIRTDLEDLIPYSFDGTAALSQMPAAVAFVTTPQQVASVMRFADANHCPVVARGSGTGLSGGSVPLPNCIVLCLSRMNNILEFDEQNLTILAEAGAITQTVADLAGRHGLLYPPDPGSMKISTIGGNVAENSGGLRGLKYGVTRDYVMGLEVVLADGRILWLGGKCVKDVAGYSLKDLFIGSEGTLGVITKVLLKLVPKPPAKRTLLAIFPSLESAAEAVSAIIAAKITPCTLEFLDNVTIRCVEAYAAIGLPVNAEALLLMETDGHPAAVEDEALKMETLARRHGAQNVSLAGTEQEAARLSSARRHAFSSLARLAPTVILEDVTVPRSELAALVRQIQEVAQRHAVRIGIFGHMGDGNLHPTFLTNERNAAEMQRVESAMREIFECAVKLGGTITGEHGVGLAKKPFLPMMVSPGTLELMRQLKRTLDPRVLLNPGKIFDP